MNPKDDILKEKLRIILRRRIIKENGCWIYTGKSFKEDTGHGIVTWNGNSHLVSRLSMHFFRGFDLDSDLYVLHKIECSTPKCFNPEHLYIGTHADNMRDKVKLHETMLDLIKKKNPL